MSFLYNTVSDGGGGGGTITNEWRMGEGSGSSLADSEGSISATLYGGTGWESGAGYTDGYRTTYNGSDGYGETDSTGFNPSQFTAMGWFTFGDISSGGRVFSTNSSGAQDAAWEVRLLGSGDVGLYFGTSSSYGQVVTLSGVSTSGSYFLAAVGDGNSGTLYLYDSAGVIDSGSGTETRATASRRLRWMTLTGSSNFTPGTADAIAASTSTAMSQSAIENHWSATSR